jgi:hypothetical protein
MNEVRELYIFKRSGLIIQIKFFKLILVKKINKRDIS